MDAAAAIMVDVQNTLVNYPITRYGSDDSSAVPPAVSPAARSARTRCRSQAPARTRSASTTRARRGRATTGSSTAGSCGSPTAPKPSVFVVFANVGSARRATRASRRSSSSATSPASASARRKTSSASAPRAPCELMLDDCEVPAGTCSGEVGKGYKIAIETLNEGRIGIGAQMIGVAQGALDAAIAYVKERKQFGKPLSRLPGHAVPARAGRDGARGGTAHGLQRGPAQGRRPRHSRRRRRWPSSSRRRSASA